MPTKMRTRSRVKSVAIKTDVFAIDAVERPKADSSTRLAIVRIQIIAMEFFAVACSAGLAGFLYHTAYLSASFPMQEYTYAALYIAGLVLLVSIAFQQFSAIQMRPLHVFLWNGIGAVALAF